MTTITPASTAQQPASSAQSATVLNSDFETFLKMLTVQMQNQDPLNPMDSSEYSMQLATFSGLEQQVLTNDLLSSLIYMNSQSGMAELAGWIGLEGRSSGPASFDGNTGVEVMVAPVDYADAAQLVVYDESGTEVDRMDIGASDSRVIWDGTGPNGATLNAGLYRFQVESYVNGNLTETSYGETWGRITEARSDSGAIILVLDGGGEVFSDDISGVRQPQG